MLSHNIRVIHSMIKLFSILTLVVFTLAACDTSDDDKDKTFKIGVINSFAGADPVVDGFKASMAEYDITIEEYVYASASSDEEQLAANAEALVEAEVDLIFSITTRATLAAQTATQDSQIPIIFVGVDDPVGTGLVETIQTPGGNVTGILYSGNPEQHIPKRMEWMLKIVPDAKRFWVPIQPDLEELAAPLSDYAEANGLELVWAEATTEDEAQGLLEAIPDDVDAIYWIGGTTFSVALITQFVNKAIELQLPFSATDPFTEFGALMTYGPDLGVSTVQAARLAHQVLTGSDVATLPVEYPDMVLNVNLVTAERINVEVPDEVLDAAYTLIREESD